jgi:hypothetical protein
MLLKSVLNADEMVWNYLIEMETSHYKHAKIRPRFWVTHGEIATRRTGIMDFEDMMTQSTTSLVSRQQSPAQSAERMWEEDDGLDPEATAAKRKGNENKIAAKVRAKEKQMQMLFDKDTDWDRLYRLALSQSHAAAVEYSLYEGSDFTYTHQPVLSSRSRLIANARRVELASTCDLSAASSYGELLHRSNALSERASTARASTARASTARASTARASTASIDPTKTKPDVAGIIFEIVDG